MPENSLENGQAPKQAACASHQGYWDHLCARQEREQPPPAGNRDMLAGAASQHHLGSLELPPSPEQSTQTAKHMGNSAFKLNSSGAACA